MPNHHNESTIIDHRVHQAPIKVWIFRLGLLLFVCIGIGFYAIYTQSVNDSRLSVLLFALPIGIGLLVLPDTPRVLMTLLVLSLSFSARFRLSIGRQFYAGAEASVAPLDLPLLGLVSLWLANVFVSGRGRKLRLGRIGKAFLALLGIYLLSSTFAYDRGLALLEVIRLLKMGLLVLIIRHYVRSKQAVVFVVNILLICIIIQGGLAISQTVFHTSFGLGFLGERDMLWRISRDGFSTSRAGGTLGHANALANYFELLLPLAFALLIGRVRGALRAFSLVAFPLGMVGLFLTSSRAGWGSSIVGVGAVLWMTGGFGVVRRYKIVLAILLVLVCLGIVTFLLWGVVSQRISTFGSSSWFIRIGTFDVASRMVKQHPLLGVGVNNYLVVANQYVPEGTPAIFGNLIAHNLFYLAAAETGLVGLGVLLVLFLTIMIEGRKVAKTSYYPLSVIAIGVLGGILALCAHGMLDWLFRYDPIHTLFWFQVGLLIATRDVSPYDSESGTVDKDRSNSTAPDGLVGVKVKESE